VKLKTINSTLLSLSLSSSLFFASSAFADDRINVMECSHNEVLVYLSQPDPEASALRDYKAYRQAYVQTKIKENEQKGITDCAALLYSDLQALYERTKLATNLMVSTAPDASTLISAAMQMLGDTLCKRVDATTSDAVNEYVDQLNHFKNSQLSVVRGEFGQKALEGHVNKYLGSEFPDAGLKYRNGQLEPAVFDRNLNNKWKGKMREMKRELPDVVEDNYGT